MAIQVAIEGYDGLEQIGVGGMAAVYRARKLSIDKTVAIKVLFPYLATDESYIDRFQREAKAAASIQHENIVNVIDFGECDGAFFIVMEYYDGRTLEQLIKERPAGLPPEIAIQILLEVAYGLEAAHTLDIVHRDIKPANIIFTNQGGVKIADFGLARKSDSLTMITQHGKVIGTPAYMSPEQAAGRAVGPASDIFSFGVVAYELLGRRKPFDGRTYSEVLDQIQSYDPPPVTIANPLVAPEFERIVQRALAKDERERYTVAGELIADLETAMEKNQVTRDRRRLVSYAKDPDQYEATFAETTITACLSRGAFFMQKGNSYSKDALLEYRRVLFLDPTHERALASLTRLRGEPVADARTQPPIVNPSSEHVATRVMSVAGGVQPKPAAARRRAPTRVIVALAAVIIGGSAAAFWLASSSRHTNDAATQSPVPANGGGFALSPDANRTAIPVDSLPVRVGPPGQAEERSHTMAAGTTDTPAKPFTDDRNVATDRPAGKGLAQPDEPRADVEKRQTKAKETAPVASDLSKSVPATERRPGRDSDRPPVSEPAPAPGLLSVFFLGGVGEFWVDGKMFSHQPPFELVSIPAGVHRVACRMSGDETRRELTVTIRSGVETVIEYEVGGKPEVIDE